MPLLALIEMLAQVYFAVHAIKTGQDRYWLFIIILFPGIGCLVYFFAEYLPELQANQRTRQFRPGMEHTSNPAKRLRYLEDQVEMVPSIQNKKALAEAYVNEGIFHKAIPIYQDALQGVHENDLNLMEGLCCAYFYKSDFQGARKHLSKLMDLRGDKKGDEFDVLYARTLEQLGDVDGALKAYSAIVKLFSGEEARCRHALLLKKIGKIEEAREQFDEIIKRAGLSTKFYRKAQRRWIDIARKER